MSQKNSEIFPELIFPLDSIALEDSIASGDSLVSENFFASGDSLVSENFFASGDSLVSENFFASENNFTSEYSLIPQEIEVDPLTGMEENLTVNTSNVTALKTRTLTVKSIKCIKAGADTPSWLNDDDIYIKVGNQRIWGINSMDDGQSMTVNTSVQYSGSTKISVWDDDPGLDDLIGTITVNGFYGGPAKLVTGNGSQYSVNFTST